MRLDGRSGSDTYVADTATCSDGQTIYYPTSPSSTGTALSANCAIALGAPGSTTTVTIPQTAGGRIWFSRDATLTFLLNPGPALVEPSVTNESDPSYDVFWDFCEFTFNAAGLYVDITYVDFVSLPVGLQLENTSGTVTTVEGLPSDGLETICAGLTNQTASDGADWSDLIVSTSSGANLRALSPNSGIAMNSSLFSTYYDSYVQAVWAKYSSGTSLTIDTQASWGAVTGTVTNDVLDFGSDVGSFSVPTTANVFSNSSGPFATTTAEMGAVAARLAAAFNRSTLLIDSDQPDDEVVADYYADPITNHYARLLHATYLDGKGYAFPYDDVAPTGGADQSGSLYDPNPQLLTVTVGGPSTASSTVRLRDMATRGGQRPAGRRQGANPHGRIRRDLASSWGPAEDDDNNHAAGEDLEKGLGRGKQALFASDGMIGSGLGPHKQEMHLVSSPRALSSPPSLMTRSLRSLVPRAWAERASVLLARLEASPRCASVRPVLELVMRVVSLLLGVSVRAMVSRFIVAVLLVVFYLVLPLFPGKGAVEVVPARGMGGVAGIGADEALRLIMVDAVNVTSVFSTQR